MNRIIFPIDFSDCSVNAFKYALDISDKLRAVLHLIHAYQIPVIDVYMPTDMISALEENEEEKALENFRKFISKHGNGSREIVINQSLKKGFPAEVIGELSASFSPDLIIMGTKGASGLNEAVLGSITSNVISKSNRPVLAIPCDAKFKGFERVVYASDFEETDFDALDFLLNFTSLFNAHISCIHVSSNNQAVDEKIISHLRENYKQQVEEGRMEFKLVKGSDFEDSIDKYCLDNNTDLLAMTTHRHGVIDKLFKRSKTLHMACHTKIPLLAFHA